MYCKNCGKQLRDGAQYCQACGQKVTIPKEAIVEQDASQPSAVQEKVQGSASRAVTEPDKPVAKSGVVKGFAVGAVFAVVVIALGVVVLVFSSRRNNDEDEQSSTRYEEARESSDSDSQEYIFEPEPAESGSSEIQESDQPTSASEVEQQPASQYILPTSNTQYLTVADLTGLTKDECRIARNELYARHGRRFKDEELQGYFNSRDWYEGTIAPEDFNDSVLNEYEIANRDLIVQYEAEYFKDAEYYANWPEVLEFELSDGVLTFSSDGGAENRYGWSRKGKAFYISYPVADDCVWWHTNVGEYDSDSSYESMKKWLDGSREDADEFFRKHGQEELDRYVQSPFCIVVEVKDGQVVKVYTSVS